MGWSWSNFRRELDWQIKHIMRLSPRVRKRTVKELATVVAKLEPAQKRRYQTLATNYDLSSWAAVCNADEVLGNLHILDVFDQALRERPTESPSLDIGARNWWYLPALNSYQNGHWDGVEIDAYQRYLSLETRLEYAEYMCQPYAEAHYHPCSLLDITTPYRLITWLRPYVTIGPLQSSGLPDRLFEPQPLLQHAWSLLETGGLLFVLNQSEEESVVQGKLFEQAGIEAENLGCLDSPFAFGDDKRHGWLALKP